MSNPDFKLGGKQYPSDGDLVCFITADGKAAAGSVTYYTVSTRSDARLSCFDGSNFYIGNIMSGRFYAAGSFEDARYVVLNDIAQAQRDLHYPDGDKSQIERDEERKDGLL